MKRFLALCLAFFCLTGFARAQLIHPFTNLPIPMNGSYSGATNVQFTLPALVSQLAIQVNVSNVAANASNTVLVVQKSLDNVNWSPYASITLVNGGTSTTSCYSNWTVGADRLWKVSVTNTGTSTPANNTNFISLMIFGKVGL